MRYRGDPTIRPGAAPARVGGAAGGGPADGSPTDSGPPNGGPADGGARAPAASEASWRAVNDNLLPARERAGDPAARARPPGLVPSLPVGLGYGVVAALVAFALPPATFDPASRIFLFWIGVIGIWRLSWWGTHLVRAVWYVRVAFPRLRRRAAASAWHPDHVYVLVTSYRIPARVTFLVYESILRNAADYGVPTTVIASLSDRSDVEVLDAVMEAVPLPPGIAVRYMYQRGDGKRSAMAEVLRAVSRQLPTERSVVVFMDGDIRLTDGAFRRSMAFFHDRGLGALTTHNRGIVEGGAATREWYDLRYAQRHLVMASLALSRRLLVLTGRYSVIRADLATDPGFIDQVENDAVDHWRFGRFKFLSGDDKSTWFWLLRRGWKMLYLPDVEAHGFEALPGRGRFLEGSVQLMARWYGNMLRINGRAVALGPKPMGLFTWWALVDQRMTVWTGLIGPTTAILMAVFVRPSFLLAYLLWIMTTRLLIAAVLGLLHGRFSFWWPILLYYGQVSGALVKGWISFRTNRQKWTRQGIATGTAGGPWHARLQPAVSTGLHVAALVAFVYAVALMTRVLPPPDGRAVAAAVLSDPPVAASPAEGPAAGADDWWVAPALAAAPDGGPLRLPAGEVRIAAAVLAGPARTDRIAGAGAGATVLVVAGDRAADSPRRCGTGADACRLTGPDGRRWTIEDATLHPAAAAPGRAPETRE